MLVAKPIRQFIEGDSGGQSHRGPHWKISTLVSTLITVSMVIYFSIWPKMTVLLPVSDSHDSLVVLESEQAQIGKDNTSPIYVLPHQPLLFGTKGQLGYVVKFRDVFVISRIWENIDRFKKTKLTVVANHLLFKTVSRFAVNIEHIEIAQSVRQTLMKNHPSVKNNLEFDRIKINTANVLERRFIPSASAIFLFFVIYAGTIAIRIFFSIREHRAEIAATLVLLTLYCGFIITLQTALPFNHGPDEHIHYFSGSWFLSHFLPPSLAQPHYRDWLYGINYLVGSVNRSLNYFSVFAIADIFDLLSSLNKYLLVRYAQLILFVIILIVLLRFTEPIYPLAILGIFFAIPQLSFIATYFNNDFLSFALAGLCLSLMVSGRVEPKYAAATSLIILLNIKVHFTIVLIPVAFIYFRRQSLNEIRNDLPWLIGAGIVGAIPTLLSFLDPVLSGISYREVQIEHAAPRIRDKIVAGGIDWRIGLDFNWYLTSFKSFYAIFGWMRYSVPITFYLLCPLILILLFYYAKNRDKIIIIIVSSINLSLSLYYSMSYGYQAQGRYLLPSLICLTVLSANRASKFKFLLFGLATIILLVQYMMDDFAPPKWLN